MLYAEFGIVIQEPVYDTICAAQMTLKGDYTFRKLGECGLKQLAHELFKVGLPTFEETTEGKAENAESAGNNNETPEIG